MADGPKFALFVRSVPGFAVQRYGTRELIGARRVGLTAEQRASGEPAIIWSSSIVPLPEAFCRKYSRELSGHLRSGELVEVKREDWERSQREDKE